jgi:hypothetical protein
LGFAVAVFMLETDMRPRRNLAGWILAGGLLGFSVLVEYTLAIACVIIGFMILWKLAKAGKDRVALAFLGLVVGIMPCAILFFAHNYLTFGSFLDIGYKHELSFPGMKEGILGLSVPKSTALWGIIASSRHGILWISPILALTPVAFWASFHCRKTRLYPLAALIVVVYFIAMNASYHYWDGGCSTGPRHLTPALGFACFPLGFLWTASGRKQRAFMISVFTVSFSTSMACTLVSMTIVPKYYSNPLFQKLIPDFLSGRVINLGQLCGLSGYWSLVPLVLLWAVGARHITRFIRGHEISKKIPSKLVRPYVINHIDSKLQNVNCPFCNKKTYTQKALKLRTKTLMPLILAVICYSMTF